MSGLPLRVLLLPDFGPQVGGGHAMRCLTLGAALADQGAAVALGCTSSAQAALAPFWPRAVSALTIDHSLVEGAATARRWGANLVILDHYGADDHTERCLAACARLAIIDDLAARPHACWLLIDPAFGTGVVDPVARVTGEGTFLAGPQYALLRPEFASTRPAALARRGARVERVLLSIGLTDLGGLSAVLAELTLHIIGPRALDIVTGYSAPSRARLERLSREDDRVRLHLDAVGMAELMTRADLAIGAGGSSVWERACLGLPSLCVILADNQAPMAALMAERGLCLTVDARAPDFESAFAVALYRLLSDDGLRAQFSARTAALCDGLGAQRVAKSMLDNLP